jgi:predicted nucleotidyltransferase
MTEESLIKRELFRISNELKNSGVAFALVGGLAVSLRGEERTTRDVDLAVSVDSDLAAETTVKLLLERGYRIQAVLEKKSHGRLATVRLDPPTFPDTRSILVDLLFASCGIEPEIVQEAEQLEIYPDLTLPVATLSSLLSMKILSADDEERFQDKADILSLLRNAKKEDLDRTKELLALIDTRGFGRGRDLLSNLGYFLDLSKKSQSKGTTILS